MGCGASANTARSGKYEADAPKEQNQGGVSSPTSASASTAPPPSSPEPDTSADTTSAECLALALPEPAVVRVKPSPAAAHQQPKHKESRAALLTNIFKNYEAKAAAALVDEDEVLCEPLVSPENVQVLAYIMGTDLAREGCLVPAAKLLLSSFLSAAFRQNGKVSESDVQHCLQVFAEYRANQRDSPMQSAAATSSACVECNAVANCYCPDCEDTLCSPCFAKLHSKGNRTKHVKLDVSFVGYKVKSIDSPSASPSPQAEYLDANDGRVFNRWHPFVDAQGLKFFYNFERQESVKKIAESEFVWQPPPPLPLLPALPPL